MSEDEDTYYILNRGSYWWRVDGHGYTQDLNEAWCVTERAARAICRDRPTEDVAFPSAVVDAHAKSIRIVREWCFGRYALVPEAVEVSA